MRSVRQTAGMSLREAERRSGRGRGNLSQIETGKARPNRSLVEWYDETLGGDGLLIGLYFEARTGHAPAGRSGASRVESATDDAVEVTDTLLPQGALVAPGRSIEVGWTLANIGGVDWRGRTLSRVGAHAGPRLLASPPHSAVPDCESGCKVDVHVAVQAPEFEGTCVAYWQMATRSGAACFTSVPYLCVQLVVRA